MGTKKVKMFSDQKAVLKKTVSPSTSLYKWYRWCLLGSGSKILTVTSFRAVKNLVVLCRWLHENEVARYINEVSRLFIGPGGPKWKAETKWNFMFWSAECSLLRIEGFSCSLDVLYGGPGICKLNCNFLSYFFTCTFFPVSGHRSSRSGFGSGLVFGLKCWIRIRNTDIFIRKRREIWKIERWVEFLLLYF
jgi:hypothetical protein